MPLSSISLVVQNHGPLAGFDKFLYMIRFWNNSTSLKILEVDGDFNLQLTWRSGFVKITIPVNILRIERVRLQPDRALSARMTEMGRNSEIMNEFTVSNDIKRN